MKVKHNYSIIPEVLKSHPNYALRLVRNFSTMVRAILADYPSKSNVAKRLGLIYFRITPLCNLRCVMCGQRGDKGVLAGSFAAGEAKKIVPLGTYKKVVDEIAPHKPTVYIWGGEPFMYPDLLPLVEYMLSKGLLVSVNTNGTFLEKHAAQIVKAKWSALFVSLDGFEDVNDKIRGKGSYERVIKGFEAINREKKAQGSDLPYMGVVTTVNNMNYKYLADLAEATRPFDLAWHIYNLGTYTNDSVVAKHTKVMSERLDTKLHCLEAYNTGYNEGIDGAELHAILAKMHTENYGHPIITVPDLQPDRINTYYGDLETPVRNRCPVPWCQADIDYNGNVHFCADYPDYVLGNIQEKPFFEIWNNERAKKFRKELKDNPGGIFPGCLRCYQNMLFGRKIKGF